MVSPWVCPPSSNPPSLLLKAPQISLKTSPCPFLPVRFGQSFPTAPYRGRSRIQAGHSGCSILLATVMDSGIAFTQKL